MENGSLETVSLGDYVGVVWRRKWIVLLVTAMVTAAALLYGRHQQTIYASTSQVLYNPTGTSTTQSANKNSSSGTWGTDRLDLASTPGFARDVLMNAKPHVPGLSNTQLLSQTVVAATPSGNGISFTVSDPNPNVAHELADGFARRFPDYLYANTPNQKLNKYLLQLATVKQKLSHPDQYGVHTTISSTCDSTCVAAGQAQITKWHTAEATANENISLAKLPPTTDQIRATTSTVVREATAAVKTQPQVTKTALIGMFAGLVLGIFLAFLQDVLDTRIRSAEDVGRRLRVPLLARVPATPRQAGKQLVMLAPPGPALVPSFEAYRIAKLNLTGILERTGAKAIMFTSASDNEGTSQTVANLAIVLARSGKHVILVDANMRESAQAEAFGLDNREGLSDILSGHGRLADTLTAVEVSRPRTDLDASTNGHSRTEGILEILPAGSPAADPAELLDTRTAGDLLAALRQRADVVLVDAPAMLPVTDAMVLASKVDAVVLVSRARRASRPNVVAMRRALDNCPAPALGFVFAGDSSGRRNDYGGSYMPARPYSPTDEERDPREIGVL